MDSPSDIRISVIVPVFKVEKYLPRCLDSLIEQDFENYEIIAVDDGSPDNCGAILDEYKRRHPDLIQVIHKRNGGLSDARNTGIMAAKGLYLSFVDSDDFVTPAFLGNFWQAVETHNADLVISPFVYDYQDGQTRSSNLPQLATNTPLDAVKLKALLCITQVYAWNKLYHRKFFMEMGIRFPVGSLFEDLYVTPRVLLQAKTIVYLDKPSYHYTIRGDSIMGSGKNADQVFGILASLRDYFSGMGAASGYEAELEYLHVSHLLVGRYVYGWPDVRYLGAALQILKDEYPGWIRNPYLTSQLEPEAVGLLRTLANWGIFPALARKYTNYYLKKLLPPQ